MLRLHSSGIEPRALTASVSKLRVKIGGACYHWFP